MKAQFTFGEVAKIYMQVEKVEKAVKSYEEIALSYRLADRDFSAEYAKYNYSFMHAPQSLSDLLDAKSALMGKKDKAERAAFKSIKVFGELIGIGQDYLEDYCENNVREFLSETYYFEAPKMVKYVKVLALSASKRIHI